MKKITIIQSFLGFFLANEICYCKANPSPKSLRRGPGEGYAIFRKHPFSKLNVTPTFAEAVKTYKQCLHDCAANPNCSSANFGTKEVLKGAFLCELLPNDKYNASSSFVSPVQDFVHYSIKTPCFDIPCHNGGTCIANYFEDSYNCTCKPDWKGKNCDEEIIVDDVCVQPNSASCSPAEGDYLIIRNANSACSKGYMDFRIDSKGIIHHKCSGLIVCPEENKPIHGKRLLLKTSCNPDVSKHERLESGYLKNLNNGFCVHPLNGYAIDSVVLVYWNGCASSIRPILEYFKIGQI